MSVPEDLVERWRKVAFRCAICGAKPSVGIGSDRACGRCWDRFPATVREHLSPEAVRLVRKVYKLR